MSDLTVPSLRVFLSVVQVLPVGLANLECDVYVGRGTSSSTQLRLEYQLNVQSSSYSQYDDDNRHWRDLSSSQSWCGATSDSLLPRQLVSPVWTRPTVDDFTNPLFHAPGWNSRIIVPTGNRSPTSALSVCFWVKSSDRRGGLFSYSSSRGREWSISIGYDNDNNQG